MDFVSRKMCSFSKSRIHIHPLAAFFVTLCILWLGMQLSHYRCEDGHMVSQPADLNVERPVVAISPSATLRREAEVAPVRDIVPVQQNSFASYTLCHKELYNRDDLAQYLNDLGLLGEGVEVGVKEGHFSKWTLEKWNGKKLYLVDPWVEQNTSLYNDISNAGQREMEKRFQGVGRKMSKFPGRFEIIRDYSLGAAVKFQDESLDYVYIDARHDYAGVKEDIDAWYPKLKVGGLFAGHDFVTDGLHANGMFGVQQAVNEFAHQYKKEIQSIAVKDLHRGRRPFKWELEKSKKAGYESPKGNRDYGWTTWYVIK